MHRLPIVLLGALVACGPAATHPAAAPATPASPQPRISSEEDFNSARAEYEALAVGSPERRARHAILQQWVLARVQQALDGGHLEEADEQLKQALTLYDADELHGAVDDKPLGATVAKIEQAFRRRGAHQEVMVALAVQISLAPADGEARRRYQEVASWLRSSGATDDEGGMVDGHARVVEDLEAVARLWPSAFVVEQLTALYTERPAGDSPSLNHRLHRGADLRELLQNAPKASLGYDVARLYLRISRPDQALEQVKKLNGDEQLRTLLEKLTAPTAQATDAVAVAIYLTQQGRDDRDVAVRVCRDAARRFPNAPEPRVYAGQLALSLDQLVVALKNFEEAVRLEPGRRDAWEALAKLYQLRLLQLVSSDDLNIDELEKQLHRVEAFHAEAAKRFPDKPLRSGMAGALLEVGRGYFNAGRLTEATKYLERSTALEATSPTLELLGQIKLKKGAGREAVALFERAATLPNKEQPEQIYWRAKLRRQIAEAFDSIGDADGAASARKAAIADWDIFLGFSVEPDYVGEAWIEKGKLLYLLGERDESMSAFGKGIDAQPERGNSYADVIAFLVPRGEVEEAVDAYHRALGRSEVTDYLKVYCSLWVLDLLQRSKQAPDPLAVAYLQSTDGGKWWDDLARWATGRESEAKMLSRADTVGRKAECAFYRAMRAAEEGRAADARALWREVVGTDMLAFFEYDMAAFYLKAGGAPSEPVLKSRPAVEHAPAPHRPPPPPDGSI